MDYTAYIVDLCMIGQSVVHYRTPHDRIQVGIVIREKIQSATMAKMALALVGTSTGAAELKKKLVVVIRFRDVGCIYAVVAGTAICSFLGDAGPAAAYVYTLLLLLFQYQLLCTIFLCVCGACRQTHLHRQRRSKYLQTKKKSGSAWFVFPAACTLVHSMQTNVQFAHKRG